MPSSLSLKTKKLQLYTKLFQNMLQINGHKVGIEMGSEDYEVNDKLESIAKSLESLAESQKRIADTLEWMAKEKEIVS